MRNKGFFESQLHLQLDILKHRLLVALHQRQTIEVLLHCLQLIVNLTLEVAHARSIRIQVSRYRDHLHLSEAVKSCLDRDLEAGLEGGD